MFDACNATYTFVCGVAPWQYELFKIFMSLFLIKKMYFKTCGGAYLGKLHISVYCSAVQCLAMQDKKGQCSTVQYMSVQDISR
jgi:hypothetical protein